ncbi:conserved hypothetical protein [Sulfurimonas denitrificans DSM 1251]|uniref:DUF2325 domain-containing protein n=1 Tax=Sulfurimonas denitrificans (strain ATCC 33889 / DSM 1251) TaxID=326298 RepID=Q30RU0_SULDN|nr:DUF2325 domain-containing protein [Sulfurimonas denitrificans]ABB44291.1 conserved hypothetical protein [Sulfurimonas denitrificans DSM 1251]MDD3442016.1 DUF2325 domain-containing protein [Sulfurimonas denitrificans]
MSVLVIGGDKISSIESILKSLGVLSIVHWDARKKASTCKKIIPIDIECVVMLTSFLNHNAMKYFRNEAKKRELPIVCSKNNSSCLYNEYIKIMKNQNCFECDKYAKCNYK